MNTKGFLPASPFCYTDCECDVCQWLAFFTTLGRDIRFGTVEHVPSRTAKQLAKSLMKIVKLYTLSGFGIRTVIIDGEFEKIKPEVELDVNISTAREHVGEIERYHKPLK